MKILKTFSQNYNGVNQGFNLADTIHLRRFDDTMANPSTQIFAMYEDGEEEEEEFKAEQNYKKYCPKCLNYNFRYNPIIPNIYYCYSCSYRQEVEQPPSETEPEPHNMYLPFIFRGPYAQTDERDTTEPFVKSMNVRYYDDQELHNNPNVQIVSQSSDRRVMHIRVKGSPAEALSAMNQLDNIEGGD